MLSSFTYSVSPKNRFIKSTLDLENMYQTQRFCSSFTKFKLSLSLLDFVSISYSFRSCQPYNLDPRALNDKLAMCLDHLLL